MSDNFDRRRVYALGGGCFCYSDIPFEIRSPSVFKGSGAAFEYGAAEAAAKKFLPLNLFDGTMRKVMLDEYDWHQWEAKVCKSWMKDVILSDVLLVNKQIGLYYRHSNLMKITQIDYLESDEWFGFFDKNKYDLLYVIEMYRCGYQRYPNDKLIEFEEWLALHGYNLENFMYCEFDECNKARYEGCKIKLVTMPKNDKSLRVDGKTYGIVKGMFADENISKQIYNKVDELAKKAYEREQHI